jgi:type IV secretory pathway TrbL component
MQTQQVQQIQQTQARHVQIRHMQSYVLALVSLLYLFGVTFLIAYVRVGGNPKFSGIPVKSLNLETQWDVKSLK